MNKHGNTLLITGGGTGIGRALAHRWHDAGNKVIITGRRQDALDEAAAGREGIATWVLDVTDADDVSHAIPLLLQTYPHLNVLVNNAGVFSPEDITSRRDLSDVV